MTSQPAQEYSRRHILSRASNGFGMAALAGLLGMDPNPVKAESPFGPRPAHFEPKAKHVIFCYMSGGFSQCDSFDHKPRLQAEAGKPIPFKTERTQFNNKGTMMPSHWEFKRRGESGLEISELFPHLATCADDLAIVKSMTAEFSEHAQANYFMHTGFPFRGHPSAGAWMTYGLGSENENLPDSWSYIAEAVYLRTVASVSLVMDTYLRFIRPRALLWIANPLYPTSCLKKPIDGNANGLISSTIWTIDSSAPQPMMRTSNRQSATMKWPTKCRPLYLK